MRIHYLEHVPREDVGSIRRWVEQRGHALASTPLYAGAELPALEAFDWLVVMGGLMSVGDHEKYPWLVPEKHFIEESMANEKMILGICLGAQLIADVMGAGVRRTRSKEVGWFPVELTDEAGKSLIFKGIPRRIDAFHWHGDTFDLPRGAKHMARSEACENQAFVFGDNVVAIQFHLEMTKTIALGLVEDAPGDLVPGRYVQTPDEIFSSDLRFERLREHMAGVLDGMEQVSSGRPARTEEKGGKGP